MGKIYFKLPKNEKQKKVPHSKIFSKLLNAIPKNTDFRKLAGLAKDDNLSARHYIVYTVKSIVQLAKKHKWDICQHLGFVYLFNGCYWNRIEDEQLQRFLGDSAKKIGWEESFSDHYQQRKHLLKQFYSEAYLPAPKPDLNKVLINLQNGTFEITETSTNLKNFEPTDFLTYQLPFKYDPEATAPKFVKYLNEVLPNESLQKVLSEYTGYIFIPTASMKLEKVLMLYGSGSNGKSVYFDILKALVGNENFSTYSLQSLTDGNGHYRADLANRLINYASEISGRVETSYFKTLASGEPVEARLLYKDPIIIQNYARLIFNVNQLPHDVEHTEGFFRRFIIMPFNVKISKEQRDIHLAEKIIQDELPGIFNWALEGLHRLMNQDDFTYSPKIESEISSYRKESDSVALFMDENGYTQSLESYIPQKELYKLYRNYVTDNGYKPVSNITFGRRLEHIGYNRETKSVGKIVNTEKSTNKSF